MRYGRVPLGLVASASGGAVKVYTVLSAHACRRTGAAWPSAPALAALLGLGRFSEKRVRDWLAELISGRWIEELPVPGRASAWQVNCAPGVPWPVRTPVQNVPARPGTKCTGVEKPSAKMYRGTPVQNEPGSRRKKISLLRSESSSGPEESEKRQAEEQACSGARQGMLAGVPQLGLLPAFSKKEPARKEARKGGGEGMRMFQVALASRALVNAGQNPGRLPGDLLWLIGSLNLATTFAEEYARRQADGGRWVVAALLRVRDELAAAQARRRGPIESARGYFCAICRSDEAPGERALEEAGRLLREHLARMTAPEERAVGDRIGGGA